MAQAWGGGISRHTIGRGLKKMGMTRKKRRMATEKQIKASDTNDDLGVGGKDPFGNPLSFTKYTQQQVAQGKTAPIIKGIPEENIAEDPLTATERAVVNGSFKVPGLRNVEPYCALLPQ
jgi:hypothetical protein